MHEWQMPTRHMHDEVMLDMVIDPIGRNQQARQKIGFGGSGVAERVIIIGHNGVLGNISEPRNCHMIGQERQKPEHQIIAPMEKRAARCQNHYMGDKCAAQFRPKMLKPSHQSQFFRPERIEELRFSLLIAGLPAQIAP